MKILPPCQAVTIYLFYTSVFNMTLQCFPSKLIMRTFKLMFYLFLNISETQKRKLQVLFWSMVNLLYNYYNIELYRKKLTELCFGITISTSLPQTLISRRVLLDLINSNWLTVSGQKFNSPRLKGSEVEIFILQYF